MGHRRIWDRFYADIDGQWAWKDRADPFLKTALESCVSQKPRPLLLEVGCGDGRNVSALCEMFPDRVWFLDVSKAAIDGLRAKLPSHVLDSCGVVLVGDVYALPFSDASFDIVVGTLFFDHLDDLDRAVEEIFRVLKTGGILLAQFSTLEDDAYQISRPVSADGRRRILHGIPYVFFSEADVMRLLSNVAADVEISRFSVVDPPHPGWREIEHEHVYWVTTATKA